MPQRGTVPEHSNSSPVGRWRLFVAGTFTACARSNTKREGCPCHKKKASQGGRRTCPRSPRPSCPRSLLRPLPYQSTASRFPSVHGRLRNCMFRQKLGSDLANSWCGGTRRRTREPDSLGPRGGRDRSSPPGNPPERKRSSVPTRQCSGRLVDNLARVGGTRWRNQTRANGLGMVGQ